MESYEPHHKKTCLRGLWPGKTQLESWKFVHSNYRYNTISVVVELVFYGPSTHFRSFRARSVNLATLFLGKPPRQFTSSFASNWPLPFLNQRERMVVETFPWPNLNERKDLRIEPATVRIPGGRASDQASVLGLYYLSREQQRCWSDCMDVQADFHLCCLHRRKTNFVMTRLIYNNDPKFSDRQVWANSVDQDQRSSLIRVYTVCQCRPRSHCSREAVWSGSTIFAIPCASFGRISLRKATLFKFQGDYHKSFWCPNF